MVTSAVHSQWPLDVEISDLAAAGLTTPSIIRMKVFSRDNRLIVRQVGSLAPADREELGRSLTALLGLSLAPV
jgi:mRNA interferase MazF